MSNPNFLNGNFNSPSETQDTYSFLITLTSSNPVINNTALTDWITNGQASGSNGVLLIGICNGNIKYFPTDTIYLNPPLPSGITQYIGFLGQATNGSTAFININQTLTFNSGGNYILSFYVAPSNPNSSNVQYNTNNNTINISVSNGILNENITIDPTNWQWTNLTYYISIPIAGSYTFTLQQSISSPYSSSNPFSAFFVTGFNLAATQANITNYTVNGQDLNQIFAPYISGTPASPTNYKVNGNDLNTIFAPYTSGPQANITNYTVNGNDLNTIFKPLLQEPYTITNSSNLTFTEYNNNGYTGLVFEVNNSLNNATASLTFNLNISNAFILCVGGGGAGDYGTQNGGGGGGITYLTNYNIQSNNTNLLQIGKGGVGGGAGVFSTDGSNSYFNDNTNSYIGYAGTTTPTGPSSNNSSGSGGNSSVVDGGGGGAGGLYGFVFPSGFGGTNSIGGNPGSAGSLPPSGRTGGNGGDSYFQSISIPFLPIYPSSITVGGGGGGGGEIGLGGSQNGGEAGKGIGGLGCAFGGSGTSNGGNGTNSITTGYGGGGGGSGRPSTAIAGNGGNGVVIIWYSNQ